MRDIAIQAAQAAGQVLQKYFEMTGLERSIKSDSSFATIADTEAEQVIVGIIEKEYPDHGIVGEEGTSKNTNADYQWIVDPLDGTGNFANGIPIFAVSIAVVHKGIPIIAVVHNPVTNSLFVAEKGQGTFYNGKPARVSTQTAQEGLVTFGYSAKERDRTRNLFAKTGNHFKSSRLLGSTALELGYLARGGTEGFICIGLYPWDYVAGQLLVSEAGGTITDCGGNVCSIDENYFIASNGIVHEELQKLVNSA